MRSKTCPSNFDFGISARACVIKIKNRFYCKSFYCFTHKQQLIFANIFMYW